MTTSATITALWRYPVKSLQGERVQETEIDASGIVADRRLALRDVESNTILSAKKAAFAEALLSWSARVDDDDVMVKIDGEWMSIGSQRAEIDGHCSALLGRDVTLVEHEPAAQAMYSTEWPDLDGLVLSGVDVDLPLAMSTEAPTFVDLAALHLITAQSLRSIAAMTPDTKMPVERFRPSMVIDLDDTGDGFVENAWQGRRARIGEVELDFTMLTPRCVMTARAQPMCDEDLEVLRSLIANNRVEVEALASNSACLGIYAEVTSPGIVAVGDRFELIDNDR